jgi:hypothetical protein
MRETSLTQGVSFLASAAGSIIVGGVLVFVTVFILLLVVDAAGGFGDGGPCGSVAESERAACENRPSHKFCKDSHRAQIANFVCDADGNRIGG